MSNFISQLNQINLSKILSDLSDIASHIAFKCGCGCFAYYELLSHDFSYAHNELNAVIADGAWMEEQARLDVIGLLKQGRDMTANEGLTFVCRRVDRMMETLEEEYTPPSVEDAEASITSTPPAFA